jgi:DNA mismatch repair protein MutL
VPDLSERMMWTSRSDFGFNSPAVEGIWSTRLPPVSNPTDNQFLWEPSTGMVNPDAQPDRPDYPAQPELSGSRVPILRSIGQIASAYLVAEGPDGLYLIDQHAAHERVLFERFIAQMEDKIPSQSLMQTIPVELSSTQSQLMVQLLPILNKMGFEIEPFGLQTYLIRSIPTLFSASDPSVLLRSLVENFEEDESPLQDRLEAKLIARICKRSAVKSGMELSGSEQKALLLDLENCESPRTCPHGRPTMIHLSVDLLEKQFGRHGAR